MNERELDCEMERKGETWLELLEVRIFVDRVTLCYALSMSRQTDG